MNSLPNDLNLQGDVVALEPLKSEHEEPLIAAASDGELWNLTCTAVPDPSGMRAHIADALAKKQTGKQFPFVVRRLLDQQIVGSTRYYNIRSEHRNLSIGFTWYGQSAQRSAVNTETKLLLLTYAFEKLKCISVAFHVDDTNHASQAAVFRLGAKHEGVLRNDRVMPDGRIRHTYCYSITDAEWSDVKRGLVERLNR